MSVDDDNVDQNEVEKIILEKTKNKLYEIFLKQCKNTNLKRRSYTHGPRTGALVTPGKRKTPPQPELLGNNPTKAACLDPVMDYSGTQRERFHSMSGSRTTKVSSTRQTKGRYRFAVNVQPGQTLLTNLWKKKSLQNLEDQD